MASKMKQSPANTVISARIGNSEVRMMAGNREFRRKRDLLWLLTKKEITLKYKRTFLGILWSLLNPILLTIVLFFAFKIFMRIQMENYTFFLLAALFPWNWFSASITMSTGALIGNVSLIKKVIFPRHFLIIATVLAQLVNLLFAMPIIVAFSYYYGEGPGINWLITVPILIVIQFIVTTGICLMVSVINAYFRDMEYIIGVIITMLFWMTPIIYPLDIVPEAYRIYLILNPLTYLITAWRDIFMSNSTNWSNIIVSFGISLAFFLSGIFFFQRLGRRLDEVI